MIPIGDARRRFGFPWVTTALLLLFAVLFFLEHYLPQERWDGWVQTYALTPAGTPGRLPILVLRSALSCLFVTGRGWLEPIVNLLYFWVLGRKLEDACGPWRFLFLFLFCGVGGVVAQLLVFPTMATPFYGLAGVVAGLLGAYFVLYRMEPLRAWIPPLFVIPLPAFLHLLYWAGLQFVNVDLQALRSLRWSGILGLEPNWPSVGVLLVGLLGGYLFARQEFLYYQTLRAGTPA